MTPSSLFVSSIISFGLILGVPLSTNAEIVSVVDKASTGGSFSIAQTQGMNRRGDRRDSRQDCVSRKAQLALTSAIANSRGARLEVVEHSVTIWMKRVLQL